jgi:hypothetical protein
MVKSTLPKRKLRLRNLNAGYQPPYMNSENDMSIVDPEKGEPDRFDLREYMHSTNDANTATVFPTNT